jgi:hypothetical protein
MSLQPLHVAATFKFAQHFVLLIRSRSSCYPLNFTFLSTLRTITRQKVD